MAMSRTAKAGIALATGIIAVVAFSENAHAATPGVGGGGVSAGPFPIVVPEANLPQSAINWYDQALTQLGFAGTFSDRLMGFQRSRMTGVLAPELSRLTPNTQQAIQDAVRGQETAPTSDLEDGLYRSRY
jgi:hypothetical protein